MRSGLSKRLSRASLAVLLCLCPSLWADSDSRFDRTLVALQSNSLERQAAFADIALAHLARAYADEAERALVEPSIDGQLSVRWSHAVQRYANELEFARMSLEQGYEATLTLSPLAEATVEVAGQTLMLTHPRPDQQPVYEQQVLDDFCQQLDCGLLTGMTALADPEPVASSIVDPSHIQPQWSFSVDGPSCTYAGIELQFQPGDHSGALRKICLGVFQEATELLTRLEQQQQYGVRIDWPHITLLAASQSSRQTLQLNRAGDVILLQLPLLSQHPQLFTALIPWLTARLAGQPYTLSLSAKAFGWHGWNMSSGKASG